MSSLVTAYHPFKDPIPDVLNGAVRAWVSWLKALFSSRPPGEYRWVSNQSETDIIIVDQAPQNMESPNTRPLIVTQIGSSTWTGSGMSQQLTVGNFLNEDQIFYQGLISASFSINCIAREGAEARKLAYYIFRLIPVFEKILQKMGIHGVVNNLVVGQETSAGALVQGSSASEWKLVAVQAPFLIKDTLYLASSGEEAFQPMIHYITMRMETLLNGGS